jgi:acetoin utilization protein AcuB
MKVAELMRPSTAVGKGTSIRDAEKILTSRRIKMLPVVNRDRLVGVVTRGDIARALPSDATTFSKREVLYWLDEVTVEEFMKAPVTVTPDMNLFEVVSLAEREGMYNFPVVEGSRLLGMLHEEDIFRHLAYMARRPAVRIEISVQDNKSSLLKSLVARGVL